LIGLADGVPSRFGGLTLYVFHTCTPRKGRTFAQYQLLKSTMKPQACLGIGTVCAVDQRSKTYSLSSDLISSASNGERSNSLPKLQPMRYSQALPRSKTWIENINNENCVRYQCACWVCIEFHTTLSQMPREQLGRTRLPAISLFVAIYSYTKYVSQPNLDMSYIIISHTL